MSSIKIGKRTLVLSVIAAIAAISVSAIILYSLYTDNSVAGSALKASEATNSGLHSDKEVFEIQQCQGSNAAVSIMNINGFIAAQPRTSATPQITSGVPTPGREIGIYEFVLKPGTMGNITLAYDFCNDATENDTARNSTYHTITNSTELAKLFDSFNSTNHVMYKFKSQSSISDNDKDPLGGIASNSEDSKFATLIPAGNSSDLRISALNLTKVNEHMVEVTYGIEASRSASNNTYHFGIYGVCWGEILTIGDGPNADSMAVEWAKGPFYGCTA